MSKGIKGNLITLFFYFKRRIKKLESYGVRSLCGPALRLLGNFKKRLSLLKNNINPFPSDSRIWNDLVKFYDVNLPKKLKFKKWTFERARSCI